MLEMLMKENRRGRPENMKGRECCTQVRKNLKNLYQMMVKLGNMIKNEITEYRMEILENMIEMLKRGRILKKIIVKNRAENRLEEDLHKNKRGKVKKIKNMKAFEYDDRGS